MPDRPRTLQTAATCTALALVALLFAGRLWLIPSHVATDPNEGWNALQAMRALGTGPLYPPPGSLTSNNYPPLSFFVVGWLGRLVGDNIVAGRLVALVALLAVAGLIHAAARSLCGRDSAAPIIGTLLFLAYNATLFRSYLAMDDPQWLGHALMTAGLYLLLTANPDRPLPTRRVVAAALLILAGGLAKHNLVAIPLAATLWLARHDRRALATWLLTAATALALAAALLYQAYGADIFTDILAADRHISWARMAVRSAGPIALMLPMLAVTARLWSRRADRRIALLLLLVAISLPLGILQRSGQGVDRNAHLEALIALCLAAAVALAHSPRRNNLIWLAIPILLLLPTALASEFDELLHRADRQAAWAVMQNRIAATPGRVACQNAAFCYWAGKPLELDFFLYGQHAAIHHDTTALDHALAEHRFAGVELDDAPPHPPAGEIANPLGTLILDAYRDVFADGHGHRLATSARW